MSIKKPVLILFALMLMTGLLTACASSTPVTSAPAPEKVEVVVTATPEPTQSPYDENAPITVWIDADRHPLLMLMLQHIQIKPSSSRR